MNLIRKIFLLVCLLPLVHPIPIEVEELADEPSDDKYLLPDGLWPNHYELILNVDLDQDLETEAPTYKGKITITANVKSEVSKEVKINSHDEIKITSAVLGEDKGDGPGENLLADTGSYDKETNIHTFKLKDETSKLPVDGKYVLILEFDGTHRNDMNGFYKSSYVDKDGKKHWLLTTQFEAVAARSAFPCFDEPKYKAVWIIKVQVGNEWVDNKGYHVLSNTPLIVPENGKLPSDDKLTTFEFEPSPVPISSYLIAFIVSDFVSSNEAYFNGGKPFKTWGQERYISNFEYTLSQKAGPAALDVMAKRLKINFAYPKVDQVGIPDFSAGAMENWGLTTYRERMLFFDEETNSVQIKQSNVAVTTHELAHQWFGDLVTLHFWDDIWLNEGFADFFESHATAEINVPGLDTSTWDMIGQFVVSDLQGDAFETDGLASSRALTDVVRAPDLIENNFDNIAYAKGGSVIRMWMHVLGEDIFYDGLAKYQAARQGDVGKPELLFDNFQSALDAADNAKKPILPDGVEVQALFENWHKKNGYPVVKVTNVGNAKFNISQERFLWKSADEKEADDDHVWYIPISVSTKENPKFESTGPEVWLLADQQEKTINVGDKDDAAKPVWIIVNNQETGYYRVNYDEENWLALAQQLQSNKSAIHEINRAQIIDDALSLSRSTNGEYLSYGRALDLTKYLAKEDDYVPWAAASNGLSFLNTKLTSDKNYNYFKTHILNAVKPRYDELGLDVKTTDPHLTRLLRILIASWACKLDHKDCIDAALKQYRNKQVPPDVKSVVYCTAVRNDDEVFDEVWEAYNVTDNNLDQTIYLSALGCSRNENNLIRLLNETIKLETESIIRKQDLQSAFSSVYTGNPENVKIAVQFLSENLYNITARYGGMNPLGKILVGLANRVVSDDDWTLLNNTLTEIIESEDETISKAAKSAQSAADTLVGTKHWLDQKTTSLSQWLNTNYGTGGNNGGGGDDDGGDGAAEITISIMTLVSCLALLFSY